MSKKIDEEWWIITKFDETSGFKILQNLQKSESPDFIYNDGVNKIGIEITEIFQQNRQGDSQLKRNSEHKNKFTETLIKELTLVIPFFFEINVDINFKIHTRKSNFEKMVKEIIKTCENDLKLLTSDYSSKEFWSHEYGLPSSIDSFMITRIDALTESYNSQFEGGPLANLTNEDLIIEIKKKEKKLLKFQPFEEQWLIIREGNYYSGSFGREDNLQLPLNSLFTKVYLLRTNPTKLITLK